MAKWLVLSSHQELVLEVPLFYSNTKIICSEDTAEGIILVFVFCFLIKNHNKLGQLQNALCKYTLFVTYLPF